MRHHHVCLAEPKKMTKNFVKVADLPAKKILKKWNKRTASPQKNFNVNWGGKSYRHFQNV
jgi:hypothetical protein